MKALAVRLRSRRVNVDFEGTAPRVRETVAGWTIRETYRPPSGPVERHGRYHMVIEHQLGSGEDPQHWHYEGIRLANRIERIWPYAVGVAVGRGTFGIGLCPVNPPKGWRSNLKAV